MGVELSCTQFKACKQANGQVCHITMPFQPLANPPTCIAALYAKSVTSIESKCSLQLHKATTTPSPHTDHTRCLDTRYSYFSPHGHHKFNMP